jgi:hypothetical protein
MTILINLVRCVSRELKGDVSHPEPTESRRSGEFDPELRSAHDEASDDDASCAAREFVARGARKQGKVRMSCWS